MVDPLEPLHVHRPVAHLDRRIARPRAGRPRRSPARARASAPRRRRLRRPDRRTSATPSAGRAPQRGAFASSGEVLERLARLGLLLAGEVDAALREEDPRLGGDLEGLVAASHLVDSSRMREPSGYSHISATSRRLAPAGVNLSLSTKIGPSISRSSSPDPLRSVLGEERALLLGEELADRTLSARRPA